MLEIMVIDDAGSRDLIELANGVMVNGELLLFVEYNEKLDKLLFSKDIWSPARHFPADGKWTLKGDYPKYTVTL